MTLAGRSSDYFGLSSSPPVVTSNGTASGSALVWVVYAAGFDGTNAQLRAYEPIPKNGAMVLVNSWPIGTSSKFNQPTVDGGRVYVGTRDGKVLAFGSSVTQAMDSTPATWDPVPVGQSAVQKLKLTANGSLKVTGISSNESHFTVGAASPALTTTIAGGGVVEVPVTFTPTAIGQVSGTLTVTTTIGTVTVALSGLGQSASAELAVQPSSISFGGVAVGSSATSSVTFTNSGAATLTVNSATTPAAPFSVTAADLPAAGKTLASGASLTVPVTFAPTDDGSFTGSLQLATSGGTISVPLSGAAAAAPKLTLSDQTIDDGAVPVGSSVTRSFSISNTGGLPMTLTRSKPPVATGQGFTAGIGIGEGETLQPGESRTLTVVFTPTSTGAKTDGWDFNGGAGIQTVTFTGTGMPAGTVPGPAAADWQLNGTAAMSGTTLQLTPATAQNAVGTAFWPTPVDSRFLDISFDATIGGGNGADGQTLILADPAKVPATGSGVSGGGLGFGGLTGVAVALDTYRNGNDPSDNFVGVATGYTDVPGNLKWAATTTSAPQLRGIPAVTHRVRVLVTGTTLTVSVDGKQLLVTTVSLPAKTRIGFGGSSGGMTDAHSVSNVSIAAIGSGLPGQLAVSATSLPFGEVPMGASVRADLTISNPGDTAVTVTSSAPASGSGFVVSAVPSPLQPGQSRTITATFAPTVGGTTFGSWKLTAAGTSTTIALSGTGMLGGSVPSPMAGGWRLNGTAALVGSALQLTAPSDTGDNARASAFWPTAVRSGYLDISFDSTMGGGTGADGLSLILADAGVSPNSVGEHGGGLGYGGIDGVAVGLDTYRNGNDPSDNFVGIATGYTDNKQNLDWLATSTAVAALRAATPVTRHLRVLVARGVLTVFVDGKQTLSAPVELPDRVLLGFGASAGLLTDQHSVSNVAIATVRDATVPAAPTSVAAVPHNASAAVSWKAASDGGSAITGYTVTAYAAGSLTPEPTVSTSGATSATVSGLKNGTSYRFSVTARNVLGGSAASAQSAAVIPLAPVAVLPAVSVSDAVRARPASGTAPLTFTISLSKASATPVSVRYQTVDGTARAGTDYVAIPSSVVTFAAGQTSKTVVVTVRGRALHDSVIRGVHLRITSATGATVSDNDGAGRLITTQGPISITTKNVVVAQGAARASAVFTLVLSAAPTTGETASVVVATANGSAVAGRDYTAVAARRITFGAGVRSVTVAVPVAAGVGTAPNRTFSLVLSSPSANAVLARGSAIATLRRPGSPVVAVGVLVSDSVVARPGAGTAVLPFTISLSSAVSRPVTVRYQTLDGTAKAGADYRPITGGVVTFAPGQTSKPVSVTVFGRALHTSAMPYLRLRVTGIAGGSPDVVSADGEGVGRMVPTQGPISIGVADVEVAQGAAPTSARFVLTLSAAPAAGESLSVQVATANSSAVSGRDYTAMPTRTLTFVAGMRQIVVSVPIAASVAAKQNRTFAMRILSVTANAVAQRGTAYATLKSA